MHITSNTDAAEDEEKNTDAAEDEECNKDTAQQKESCPQIQPMNFHL